MKQVPATFDIVHQDDPVVRHGERVLAACRPPLSSPPLLASPRCMVR